MEKIHLDVRGRLTLDITERGRLIEHWTGCNVFLSQSRQEIAHLLGGDVANRSISKIGFGTSGSTPLVSNTALEAPFIKLVSGVSYPAASTIEFAFTLLPSEGNGMEIMELGLLTGSGRLIARRVRTAPLIKTSDISLSGAWTLEF